MSLYIPPTGTGQVVHLLLSIGSRFGRLFSLNTFVAATSRAYRLFR